MRGRKIALAAFVVVLLVIAQRLGVFKQFDDPSALAKRLVELGPWGYVAFVVAFALLQPFGVPGTVFVIAAPLIWPWPIAFALSMTGTMAASVIGFSFARFVARDWITPRVPARFRKWDDALARRAFVTVATLRFIFWMPQLLHAFLGISKVRFWTHFWGSFVGYLVPLFVMSFFGQKVFDALKRAPPSVWMGVGAAIVLIAAIVFIRRNREKMALEE